MMDSARIAAVGRIGHGPEAALCERYLARLRPAPIVVEVAEGRGRQLEAKRREAGLILAAVPATYRLVALDAGGQMVSSEELAALLAQGLGGTPCFALGGADGLDARVLAGAAFVLSLGRMTWPHLLARAMLAEQLYRAQSISAGHPYHRSGRP